MLECKPGAAEGSKESLTAAVQSCTLLLESGTLHFSFRDCRPVGTNKAGPFACSPDPQSHLSLCPGLGLLWKRFYISIKKKDYFTKVLVCNKMIIQKVKVSHIIQSTQCSVAPYWFRFSIFILFPFFLCSATFSKDLDFP